MSVQAIDTLVVAIVQDEDADELLIGLRSEQVGATKIGNTGGFLRTGNSTIMIGIPAVRLGLVHGITRQHCRRRNTAGPTVFHRAGTRLNLPFPRTSRSR